MARLIRKIQRQSTQEPERTRDHDRCARRLDDAGGDQDADAVCGRAERRSECEDGDPYEEAPLQARAVGQAAGGNEQGSKNDRVAVQNPRERREMRAVEAALQRGEGNVDDEEVDRRQHPPSGDDRENEA
jgi:hypothetical protein